MLLNSALRTVMITYKRLHKKSSQSRGWLLSPEVAHSVQAWIDSVWGWSAQSRDGSVSPGIEQPVQGLTVQFRSGLVGPAVSYSVQWWVTRSRESRSDQVLMDRSSGESLDPRADCSVQGWFSQPRVNHSANG